MLNFVISALTLLTILALPPLILSLIIFAINKYLIRINTAFVFLKIFIVLLIIWISTLLFNVKSIMNTHTQPRKWKKDQMSKQIGSEGLLNKSVVVSTSTKSQKKKSTRKEEVKIDPIKKTMQRLNK